MILIKLTEKQEKYCQYRFQGLTQRQAYKKAFPNNCTNESIDAKASTLEKTFKIQERLNELRGKVEKKSILSVQEILELLSKDAVDRCLSPKDRQRAMDMIMKAQGAYVNNVNLSGNVNTTVEEYIKKVETENEYGN